MARWYIQSSSRASVIRGVRVKTTMTQYTTTHPPDWPNWKGWECGWGCGAMGPTQGGCDYYTLENSLALFIQVYETHTHIHTIICLIPYRNWNRCDRTHIWGMSAAMFVTVPNWKQSRDPSRIEWLNKLWHMLNKLWNIVVYSTQNEQSTAIWITWASYGLKTMLNKSSKYNRLHIMLFCLMKFKRKGKN